MYKAVTRGNSVTSLLVTTTNQTQTSNSFWRVASKDLSLRNMTTDHRCRMPKSLIWIPNQRSEVHLRVRSHQPMIAESTTSPATKIFKIQTKPLCKAICQVSRAVAHPNRSQVLICLLRTQSR